MNVLYLEVDLEELVHKGKCTPSLRELKCSSTVEEKMNCFRDTLLPVYMCTCTISPI